MRKWMVTAGLAAAVLAVVLLLPGPPKAPAPDQAAAAAAGHPSPEPTPPAGQAPPGPHGEQLADPGPGDMGGGMLDEGSRAVLAYQLTVPKLKAYARAVKAIRAAGERDPSLLTRLRQPGPVGELPAGVAARLEAIAPVKAILERHGLAALDLALVPRAMVAGRYAYALEQEGRPLPPDQQNTSATALYRADLPGMDALGKAYADDLKFLSGR